MRQGGIVDENIRVVTRLIGLLAPFFVSIYGYLITTGYVSGDHFVSVSWLIGLNTFWIIYGIWQYFWTPRWKDLPLFTLILYHILAGIYVVTIAGFSSFIICGWAILALVSFVYYSTPGFTASIATLFVVCLIDIQVQGTAIVDIAQLLLNIIGVVLLSGAAAGIIYAYEHQPQNLPSVKPKTETDHDRLLTIMNNLADAVFVTDKFGKIELYNASCLNLLDTNMDMSKKSIDSVLRLHSTSSQRVELAQLLSSAKHVQVTDELFIGDRDDPVRLQLTYAPIRSTYRKSTGLGDEGYIIIARDITKQKSLEEERDEFISVVSHELRTPVTVAEGTISNALLFIDRGKDTKKIIRSALNEAHEQVMFLAGMINDLSTLSRAERGVAAEKEMIDVSEFAHDLYNEYRPQAEKKDLHFNLEVAPTVGTIATSRLYLHELLQNFITNAIKYTESGEVTLTIAKKSDVIEFSVKDTGIGISKSDQAKIFGKFYRSEDYRTRETSGTGLGLYVASKLAHMLHTKIEVKSRLNHGSIFTISLPIHK